jgi:beta-mannosidase
MKNISLNDWTFTQVGGGKGTAKEEYLQATGPTTVHVELLKAKRIADPFIGLNEHDAQWIGESDWIFKSSFTIPEGELQFADHVDLILEGLDTFAKVVLNGEEILETANQFVGYRVDVRRQLKSGQNELVLNFSSPFKKVASRPLILAVSSHRCISRDVILKSRMGSSICGTGIAVVFTFARRSTTMVGIGDQF